MRRIFISEDFFSELVPRTQHTMVVMKKYWLVGVSVVVCFAGACGGSGDPSSSTPDVMLGESGLPLTAYMDEMSESNRRTFCEWHASLYGGSGASVKCGDGDYVLPTTDDCAQSTSAFLHVSLAATEGCVLQVASGDDICEAPESADCEEIAAARATQPESNGSDTLCRGGDSRHVGECNPVAGFGRGTGHAITGT